MKNFVVYEVVSTMIVDHTGKVNRLKTYKSERAAKTARTKALKVNGGVLLGVMEYYEFVNTVELSVERINFMTKQPFKEGVNVPHYCSPRSETYWTM